MKRLLLLLPFAIATTADARVVKGTVYHEWYDNRITYCGTVYRHWGVSAAHPWLPCGTKVRVTHAGRTLTVPVLDRCDCAIDLSAGAARLLGVPIDGVGTVQVTY